MKSMIGYIVVMFALCLLTVLDYQSSEAREGGESAYYYKASVGAVFSAPKVRATKSSHEKKVTASNNKFAVWPERVLKVDHNSFLLAQAYAVAENEFDKSMGKELARRDGFVIFASDIDAKFEGFVVNGNKYPVVISESSGEFGVVTGNVTVKLKSPEVAGLVSSAVKSEIVHVNDSLMTATLKLPHEQDLTEVIHAIRNHKGVESADFQII